MTKVAAVTVSIVRASVINFYPVLISRRGFRKSSLDSYLGRLL
jgi:hypothetical protein